MFQNYLKIAWRNFLKQKGMSFINLSGFAVGLICSVFIYLFIDDEMRYDRHFENSENIFRLTTQLSGAVNSTTSMSSPPLAEAMRNEFPEVVQTARLLKLPAVDQHLVKIKEGEQGQSSFFENYGFLVDSTFLQIFSYELLYGNPNEALRQPYSVVLSDELASKYFGNENPLGHPLRIENAWGEFDCAVTGVFKKNPRSHIPANFFMAMNSGEPGDWVQGNNDWVGTNHFCTYLLLKEGTDAAALASKLPAFLDKHSAQQLADKGIQKKLGLEPLTAIHLNPSTDFDISVRGSRQQLYTLGFIGLFILLIACINYMNLSTARFAKRHREVGVLKVLGAKRAMLIRQFLAESVLVGLLAFGLVLGLVMPLLRVFENFTEKTIGMGSLQMALGFTLGIALLSGLLAGSYPSFFLSSFHPMEALKNFAAKGGSRGGAVQLRRGLVVLQFSISVTLIIGVLVIWQQMRFLQQTDLGFDKDQKVVVALKTLESEVKYRELKSAISRVAAVKAVSACSAHPGVISFANLNIYPAGKSIEQGSQINVNYVDEGFAELMGFELKTGRFASPKFASDTSGFGGWVLNESAVAAIGLTPETVIGQKMYADWRGNQENFEVVGVVKDFHFESLHKKISPQGFRITQVEDTGYGYMVLDLHGGNWSNTLQGLTNAWQSVMPGVPFDGRFLDEVFQQNYLAEQRSFSLLSLFAGLAIFISCLGLFGLAAHAVERRSKEMAIRKVVGASINSLARLLSMEFLKPVALALVIASPMAYFLMEKWLQDFAYQIDISWWMFVVAGIAAVGVAFLTVGFQSVKAALANPVKSLRSE